ncbi:MAG TPA: acyl carrier protein [bacterium]|nr:acyl carrier protein [bacterium]
MSPNLSADEIRAKVLSYLSDIAPEIDPKALNPALPLREQTEIDSVDFLRFVTLLYEGLKINVPEADYAKLDTLDHIVAYLAAQTPKS